MSGGPQDRGDPPWPPSPTPLSAFAEHPGPVHPTAAEGPPEVRFLLSSLFSLEGAPTGAPTAPSPAATQTGLSGRHWALSCHGHSALSAPTAALGWEKGGVTGQRWVPASPRDWTAQAIRRRA